MTFFLLRFRPVSYKEKLNNMTFEAKRPKHQEYDIPNFMMLFLHDQMCLYREGEQCIYIHTHTHIESLVGDRRIDHFVDIPSVCGQLVCL